MATIKVVRSILFAGLVGVIAGCKLAVIVVEGGEVQSTGSGTCVAGAVCIVEVNDANFTETFTAVPDPGWYFQRWNAGDGFWCGDSNVRTCFVSSEGATGIPWAEALIASSETFYLMPIFTQSPPEILSINGKQWRQPDQFTNLSWDEINAVCNADTGACSGVLNGYDMSGWTWASVDDVNALFNYYIGSEALGPGPAIFYDIGNSAWAPAFFNDGWRPTVDDIYRGLAAWTRSLRDNSTAYSGILTDDIEIISEADVAQTDFPAQTNFKDTTWGSWFYRTP